MSSTNKFGQNDWLVEEMLHRYQENPESVDKEWQDFFKEQQSSPTNQKKNSSKTTDKPASTKTAGTSKASSEKDSSGKKAEAKKAAAKKSAPAKGSDSKKPEDKPEEKESKAENKSQAAQRTLAQPIEVDPEALSKSPLSRTGNYAPDAGESPIRGMFKAIVKNMDESLEIPTATTVRDMPARLLFENRAVINSHLKRTRGGKISFTHIIGYAVVKATMVHPDMNNSYVVKDGKPTLITPEHINLGLAIDVVKKNGTRALVVAAIKKAETMTFTQFVDAYEDIVNRSREDKLTLDDYQGVTISLTNPGGIGTRHSVPRLTQGQGTIVGVGAMSYPAEFDGASEDRLADLGVGKLVTITSTYDHRIIQGAVSGEFLRTISTLFTDDAFWNDIYADMRIPYTPIRWRQDLPNEGIDKNTRVMKLIEAYRSRGHLIADTNPLHWKQPGLAVPDHRDLEIESHGLTLWDLDRRFNVGGFAGHETMTLREVLTRLRNAYTHKVGAEYTHILDTDERLWLQNHIEEGQSKPSNAKQKYILQQLNAAEAFENFLQTKYIGQKRFSLEGAEALIPLMDAAIDTAAGEGLSEVVIGMPHRGRLNVLFNVVGKPLAQIFDEFEGTMIINQQGGSGDAKYHLGATGTHYQMFGDNEIKVTLAPNPSHLEAVDPVMEGLARAKEDLIEKGETDPHQVFPIMLHGDASFAGLGIVQETINMSQLKGYTTGGTLHVVVNNQIGFTTTPDSGRSSYYATDLAKAYGAPVFHVNGDDPEAVVWVAELATEYRHRFGKDVFIDLIAYRLRGHNEADDPSVTQPLMYNLIDNRLSTREAYTRDLIGRGDLTQEESEAAERDFHDQMESVFNEVKAEGKKTPAEQTGITSSQKLPHGLDTSLTKADLVEIGEVYTKIPETFTVHRRAEPVAQKRLDSVHNGGIDWAWAELLALSSLSNDGRTVRVAGEDSIRGTYTQRHAVFYDPNTGAEFSPFNDLAQAKGNGGRFEVWNSPLSEYGGLGFEYGYTLGNPNAVVAWEAQYGDFVNGAQTIIDEYISSGEAKWGLMSRLIVLLPHGYEGAGPDHSSARIERWLQLSSEGSMTVAQPTVPANYFHMLRRHILGTLARPLVVFSPKSMLRNKAAVSSVEEFTEIKKFRSVINDPTIVDAFGNVIGDPKKVTKILLVSGKLYYELAKVQKKNKRDDVAIVRIEMLHPIPFNRLREAFEMYPNATEIRFVQDEPANQGPWPFYNEHLPQLIPDMLPMKRVSRRSMASTATGLAKIHAEEEKQLLAEAFAD